MIKNNKTIIGLCYRVPDANEKDNENLCKLIDKVGNENIVIMGDFNYSYKKNIGWISNTALRQGKLFLDSLTKNFSIQHVDKSSRSANILDSVISGNIDVVKDLAVGEHFSNSVHQIIRFNLSISYVKEKDKKVLNYFKGDYAKTIKLAHLVNWYKLISDNIITGWENFKIISLDIRDKCVPLLNKKLSKCKWINRKIVKFKPAKNKAWKKFCANKTDETYEKYKIKRNKSVMVNRIAQKDYEVK